MTKYYVKQYYYAQSDIPINGKNYVLSTTTYLTKANEHNINEWFKSWLHGAHNSIVISSEDGITGKYYGSAAYAFGYNSMHEPDEMELLDKTQDIPIHVSIQTKPVIVLIGAPKSGKTHWRLNNTEFPQADYAQIELSHYYDHNYLPNAAAKNDFKEYNKNVENYSANIIHLLQQEQYKGIIIDGVYNGNAAHDIFVMLNNTYYPITFVCFEKVPSTPEHTEYHILRRFDNLSDVTNWIATQSSNRYYLN